MNKNEKKQQQQIFEKLGSENIQRIWYYPVVGIAMVLAICLWIFTSFDRFLSPGFVAFIMRFIANIHSGRYLIERGSRSLVSAKKIQQQHQEQRKEEKKPFHSIEFSGRFPLIFTNSFYSLRSGCYKSALMVCNGIVNGRCSFLYSLLVFLCSFSALSY